MNFFRVIKVWACLMLLVSTSCKSDPKPDQNATGETLYTNAKIYTVNSSLVWAEAIIVKNDEITFVGSSVDANKVVGSDAEIIDLKGALVLPGFHDVHIHPLESASDNFAFQLDENETDAENYASAVQAADQKNPGTGWLIGYGHYLEVLLDATRPVKEILDDVVSNRPVIIMEQTSHSMWVNSKALQMAGITSTSANPTGGVIMKDAASNPNGILLDNAGEIAIVLALVPTSTSENNDYLGLTEWMLPELNKHGITSLCDARTFWKRNQHKIWKKVEQDGKLSMRVNLGLWTYPAEDDATQIADLKALYSNDPNSFLKINQIKMYSDGIVHNTTSAMKSDYLIDLLGLPTNNGLNYFSESRMSDYISQLESTGFDFHIHAIGNRGISESLNAISSGGSSMGRHRITHVEIVDPADYPRFAQLNVTADGQVAGDYTNPAHWHESTLLIGASLSNNIVPLKSLNDAGARITLSSDYSVSPYNPFIGLQNAVTRIPQELSLEDAIAAYTINAAYVMRQEDLVGSIEVGKKADFIVLDQDLFSIPANQISQTSVNLTVLNGQIIYER